MEKSPVLARIQQVGLVPVLRAPSFEAGLSLAKALAAGGIPVLEVTMTVPDAPRLIAHLTATRPDLLIGAGTVLNPEQAEACIQAGAQFVVSPALNLDTIALCRQKGIAILPGALTPTEILTAWQSGADVVKVFPASALGGAKYLNNLRGPLPHIKVIPTGGVSLATAHDFLAAGAFALGVGGDLCNEADIAAGRFDSITAAARAYVACVAAFRAA